MGKAGIAGEGVKTSRKGCFTDFELPPWKIMSWRTWQKNIQLWREEREVLRFWAVKKDLDFDHQFVYSLYSICKMILICLIFLLKEKPDYLSQ